MARSKKSKRTMRLHTKLREEFVKPKMNAAIRMRNQRMKRHHDGSDLSDAMIIEDRTGTDDTKAIVPDGKNWLDIAAKLVGHVDVSERSEEDYRIAHANRPAPVEDEM